MLAGLQAKRMSSDIQKDEIRTAVPNTVAQINHQFHLCIVEAARNQFLTHCYNDLSIALMLLGKTTSDTKQRIDHVYSQHADIISALRKRYCTTTANAMKNHMETSLTRTLKAHREHS